MLRKQVEEVRELTSEQLWVFFRDISLSKPGKSGESIF